MSAAPNNLNSRLNTNGSSNKSNGSKNGHTMAKNGQSNNKNDLLESLRVDGNHIDSTLLAHRQKILLGNDNSKLAKITAVLP